MESKDFIKGAIFGTIVGSMAGVLFAPRSGKETREEIHESFEGIKNDLSSKLNDLDEFTKEAYDKIVTTVISGYEDSKKITQEEATEIKAILESSFDQIQGSLAKTKDKISKEAVKKDKK